MPLTFLIIDAEQEYRRLLAHHLTAEWPDASVRGSDLITLDNEPWSELIKDIDVVVLGEKHATSESKSKRNNLSLSVLSELKKLPECPPVIFMSRAKRIDQSAARAVQLGADDYISKAALTNSFLINAVKQALKNYRKNQDLFEGFPWHVKRPLGKRIKIKGYQITRHINAGVVSDIFLAERLPSGTEVILKSFRPKHSIHLRDRDLHSDEYEFHVLEKVSHPNVIKIFDHGFDDDHAYVAMEYLAGGDLKSRIHQGLTELSALDYVMQIAKGLDAIHSAGIVHRDIKPSNIMFRDPNTLVIIDFGLAAHINVVNHDANTGGRVLGTPYYMSPEQCHGQMIDFRSDLYSLGIIFFEMLTGHKPYTAASPKTVLYKHTYAQLPQLPKELARFQTILDLLLAKQSMDRFESAGAVIDMLRNF